MPRSVSVLIAIVLLAAATLSPSATPKPAPAEKPAAADKSGWPDTKVGALARRWTETFGKGEPAMRACLAEIMAPEALARRGLDARMETYRASLERFGSLMLVSVDSSGVSALKVKLAASDFSTHVFTFEAQPRPPYKLLQVLRSETRHMSGHGH